MAHPDTPPTPRWRRWSRDLGITILIFGGLLVLALVLPERDRSDDHAEIVAAARDGTLSGRIVDADTTAPLFGRGASVHIDGDLTVVARQRRFPGRYSANCRYTIDDGIGPAYEQRSRVGGCRAAAALTDEGSLRTMFRR